eukprot:scaffold4263_cov101-Isochrysis_galbana.AAC.1
MARSGEYVWLALGNRYGSLWPPGAPLDISTRALRAGGDGSAAGAVVARRAAVQPCGTRPRHAS